MPKASAREFHQQQKKSLPGKPSARFPIDQEGLRRLLPEPTPSPRLWATPPGATPERLCQHNRRVLNRPPKPELSTWLGAGTFYLAPTHRSETPGEGCGGKQGKGPGAASYRFDVLYLRIPTLNAGSRSTPPPAGIRQAEPGNSPGPWHGIRKLCPASVTREPRNCPPH